jgi:hypothetical protein
MVQCDADERFTHSAARMLPRANRVIAPQVAIEIAPLWGEPPKLK